MRSPGEANAARKRLARHLVGSGIEIGAGRYPFRLLPPGSEVRFVGRGQPESSCELISETGADPTVSEPRYPSEYVEPDITADFNTDRLGPIADCSQDFVIASHVLEHLAEPMGFIAHMHRVLRPNGVALILLPDRHRTEDRFRSPTPLDHLVAEYRSGTTEVSDDHLTEFMKDRGRPLKGSVEERRRTLNTLREQSIHVHCWDAQEFLPVLLWGIEHLDERWEFVDGSLYEPPIHYEFGYVLRRSEADLGPAARSQQFRLSWQAWWDSQLRLRPLALRGQRRRALPPWAYQRARRLVRQYRLVGWGYHKANQLIRRKG